MSITGAEGGGGFKTGIAIADLTTAMFATQGILLAIIAREKTGKGQYVDTAIQDGQAALMSHAAGNFFATGHAARSAGEPPPEHRALPRFSLLGRGTHRRGGERLLVAALRPRHRQGRSGGRPQVDDERGARLGAR